MMSRGKRQFGFVKKLKGEPALPVVEDQQAFVNFGDRDKPLCIDRSGLGPRPSNIGERLLEVALRPIYSTTPK